ncbi:MAG TPA: thioredoxin [Lentimicrobium sp.]|nr:thioredoxin [Lentimicrobium sp.]
MNKRIFTLALVASLAFFGCNQTTSNGQSASNEPVKETTAVASAEAGKVIQMNKAMFLERVFNYEKSPDKWIYEGNKPCIIDFYADWCGPCKRVAPIMAELAEQYKDQIVVYKVDTDKERELAQVFGIRSIPSILFCPAEGQPQMTAGALPKAEFEKMVKEILLAPAAQPTSQK